jgi:23S rRNA pseudouridine1911/1915/1917 synthase
MSSSKNSKHPIDILYEDNHLLIVVKPPNLPTQADESGDPDLLSLLKEDLKVRYQKPGNVYLGLVHRLDRPVGGVMVFAKTSKAASRLSDQVRTRKIRKTYVAVVHGTTAQANARLTHILAKNAKTNMVSVVGMDHPDGKEAVLDYSVLGSKDGLSLVKIDLLTGRPHQIRVQFAAIGCPLFGDQRYGQAFSLPGQQIALWATRLVFEHPTTQEALTFRCPPPQALPWTKWDAPIDPD